ncbi:MAG: TolC family protein [Nitrospirales bacterium]
MLNSRRFLAVFLFLLLLVNETVPGTYPAQAANPLPIVNIGIVLDGPPQGRGIGRMITEKLFRKAIRELTHGEFDVRFPKPFLVHGNWSVKGVRKALDFLIASPQVDLVLALGVIATHEAAQVAQLPKPVIGPFVIDAVLQGLPIDNGRSGVPNLNYLSSFKSFERDLKRFLEIVPIRKLALLAESSIVGAFPLIREKVEKAALENEITISIVTIDSSTEKALSQLPTDTEAVFVTPLFRLSSEEFDRLVAQLIKRRLPSFSLVGRQEVERGILASAALDTDSERLSRRVALNVHRILLGEDAGELEVAFSEGQRLTINMATARAIDTWPSFRVLSEAELLNEKPQLSSRQLSLYTAMREAVMVNLDLAAADRKVAAGLGDVQNARSALLPRVDIGSSARMLDRDRAEGSFGNNPEKAAFATGGLKQLLYSDKAWTDYTVEQRSQDSRVAERREVELDTAQETAVTYLNVLRTKTVEQIQKDNLELTGSNLELARIRESIGSAARDEVYRWESEIANGRIEVLNAQAQRQQAEVTLNRILHRPLEESFMTAEASLNDPLLFPHKGRIFAYINNPRNFKIFRDFEAQESLRLAPELHQIDAQIAAQKRRLLNADRNFWAPDLSLESDVSQRIGQGGAGQDAAPGSTLQDRTTWNLQLGLSFPLFSGGAKDAQNSKALETLRQLQLQREATVGRIEERIRSAMLQAGASSPAIRLTREAAEASRKNLDLVIDQYSRGAVDIIKLLDSQNAALTAKLNAANAVYDFLIDLINIERAAGQFAYFLYKEDQADWVRRVDAFFAKAGVDLSKEIVRGPF